MKENKKINLRSSIVSSEFPEKISELLDSRRSQEIVIALCGPVGCGIEDIKRFVTEIFSESPLGYRVHHIKISDLIRSEVNRSGSQANALKPLLPPAGASRYEQIKNLQLLGNKFREKLGNNICAAMAIREIALDRQDRGEDPDKTAIQQPTLYLVNQLKHPEEAELLQRIYGAMYYQIGILASEEEKVSSLAKERMQKEDAVSLIEIDRRQNIEHGQQLEKTLSFSDYFIANTSKNLPSLKVKVNRFFELIHGKNGITPTNDEVGMNAAYSASLRSACLSRQVGAAICDASGNVLAVGRNDVPKYGGGLYTSNDAANDNRCVNYGAKCHNTERINFLKDDIKKIIEKELNDEEAVKRIISGIEKQTTLGSLIEYSRAIHAEMDAITSLARRNNASTQDSILYSTTYPCHNCARHIIASGVRRVVYIEPYSKSLAVDLHGDAIKNNSSSAEFLNIEPFEGVAPKRHSSFFSAGGSRKDKKGLAISYASQERTPVDEVLLTTYTRSEEKIVEFIQEKLKSIALVQEETQ